MSILNINPDKDSLSMILSASRDAESFRATVYLYKSSLAYDIDDKDEKFPIIVADKGKNIKDTIKIRKIFMNNYGTFLTSFLNADFSTAETAYNSFFMFYGIEGFHYIEDIKKKYPNEYSSRYSSSKNF